MKEIQKNAVEKDLAMLESELGEVQWDLKIAKENGYEAIEFRPDFLYPAKVYLLLMLFIFSVTAMNQEVTNTTTATNRWIRSQLGHTDLHLYLAEESLARRMPYDDEVPECDYRNMTAKRFYNDYVKTNRPCLFKEYGKL